MDASKRLWAAQLEGLQKCGQTEHSLSFLALAIAAWTKQHYGPLLPFFILNDVFSLIEYLSSVTDSKISHKPH